MSKGYNRIAGVYDRLARIVFGKAITQSQMIFLNRLANCQSVLVLGGGTGWWLNDLLQMYPHLQITFVDSSSEMIRIAREKLTDSHQVDFVCGTIDSIHSGEKFDAVVLYYFVDLFSEEKLSMTIQKIIERMNSTSFWLVSDFVNKKKWHSIFLELMYTFFRYSTGQQSGQLPDWQKKLKERNLERMDECHFYRGFIHAGLYKLRKPDIIFHLDSFFRLSIL